MKHKILIYGFYYFDNYGDDLFKDDVFANHIFDNKEEYELFFVNPETIKDINDDDANAFSLIVFGGGDLFYEYFWDPFTTFLDRLMPNNKMRLKIVAIGVGNSHGEFKLAEDFGDLTKIFDLVFFRNRSERGNYLPDLCFIPKVENAEPLTTRRNAIAICLAQGYCSKHPKFIEKFLIPSLIKCESVIDEIIIIPFSSSSGDDDENNDFKCAKMLEAGLKSASRKTAICALPRPANVSAAVSWLRSLSIKLVVALRFHAHVLSLIAGIPILSLNFSQKVKLFNETESQTPPMFVVNNNEELEMKLTHILFNHDKLSSESNRLLVRAKELQFLWGDGGGLEKVKKNVKNLLGGCGKVRRNKCNRNSVYSNILSSLAVSPSTQITADNVCYLATDRRVGSEYVWGTSKNIKEVAIDDIVNYIVYNEFFNSKSSNTINNHNNTYLFFDDRFHFRQGMFEGLHRAGWNYVVQLLRSFQHPDVFSENFPGVHCKKRLVFCDVFLDRTFGWESETLKEQGIIPYTSSWIGFIHHGKEGTAGYTKNTVDSVITNPLFLASLPTCRGIICLSKYLKDYVSNNISSAVKVHFVHHPTPLFGFRRRSTTVDDAPYVLLQVGSWYRDMKAIYQLPNNRPDLYKRKILKAPHSGNNTVEEVENKEVEILETVSNEEYDDLLASSIVFIQLFEASAVNTIIECMAREVPILVNKLPAVVEYLGEEYPFYFDYHKDKDNIEDYLNKEQIQSVREYYRKNQRVLMERISGDVFLEQIKNIIRNL